jgi:hypothetical protein
LFLIDAASDQGGDAQAVDLAGEAASVLEDTFDYVPIYNSLLFAQMYQ